MIVRNVKTVVYIDFGIDQRSWELEDTLKLNDFIVGVVLFESEDILIWIKLNAKFKCNINFFLRYEASNHDCWRKIWSINLPLEF